MYSKLIDLGVTIGKIEAGKPEKFNSKKTALNTARLYLVNPSTTIEGQDGISYVPAESIEIWGFDNLQILATTILGFCEEIRSEADNHCKEK